MAICAAESQGLERIYGIFIALAVLELYHTLHRETSKDLTFDEWIMTAFVYICIRCGLGLVGDAGLYYTMLVLRTILRILQTVHHVQPS